MPDTIVSAPTSSRPRLALGVTLDNDLLALPSVVDIASILGVLTNVFVAARSGQGPFMVSHAHRGRITSLTVIPGRVPIIASAGVDGSLLTWTYDGFPGPVTITGSQRPVTALATANLAGQYLIVSGDSDGGIHSYALDGRDGPLSVANAHDGPVSSLAVIEDHSRPLIISAGTDRAIHSWYITGEPGPLNVEEAHSTGQAAIVVVQLPRQNLVTNSWESFDSTAPIESVRRARARPVVLTATADGHGPLIISGGGDGSIRSWRTDGSPGPLNISRANATVSSMAVLRHDDRPLIVSGGGDGSLRSWTLDGEPGPLNVPETHTSPVLSVGVWDQSEQQLVVSCDGSGTVGTWVLDEMSKSGIHRASSDVPTCVTVLSNAGQPLVVGGFTSGALRSWLPGGSFDGISTPPWRSFDAELATSLDVRRLSFASPLEIVIHVPELILAAPAAFGFVLYAMKQIAGLDLEVRIRRTKLHSQLAEAEQERIRLEAGDQSAAARANVLKDDIPHGWDITDVSISEVEE